MHLHLLADIPTTEKKKGKNIDVEKSTIIVGYLKPFY